MSYLEILVARTASLLTAIALVALASVLAPVGGWEIPQEAVYGSLAYLLLASAFLTVLFWVTSRDWPRRTPLDLLQR